MSSLLVRAAVEDDLAVILGLTAEDSMHYFDEPAGVSTRQRAAFAEIIADAHQDLLVGEIDGTVVCTAQVTWMRMLSADGGLYCQVEAVRTAAASRGRGIGGELMAWIEADARRRGAARLQLTSNRQRTRAHAFYGRLGYVASHVGMKKNLL
ncbi:GNAT family N-acetyltransferase [Aeromicrobium yanjiei]|uniref:GNAT family N-acetyltransferase n=1 Tax=Aeromicrobium yanjiei TaxID=2662028 RepID=A0A5Q2MLZ5_9ACTN|nr:GNAT family N-acetyltransferase [Aeromicrobium yanjiei]QGG42901.1 GNAT family N-acetyltransferase [Aeromicrobium yanjiei]